MESNISILIEKTRRALELGEGLCFQADELCIKAKKFMNEIESLHPKIFFISQQIKSQFKVIFKIEL